MIPRRSHRTATCAGLFALFVTLFGAVPALAVEVPASRGTTQVLFALDGISGAYFKPDAATLAVRRYVWRGTALRLGVSFGRGASDASRRADFESGGSIGGTDGSTTDDSSRSTDIGSSLDIERHFRVGSAITPYVGAGIGFDVERDSDTSEEVDLGVDSGGNPDSLARTMDRSLHATTPSVSILTGIELAVTSSVTIGGEYRIHYGVRSSTTNYTRTESSSVGTDVYESTTRSTQHTVAVGPAALFVTLRW